MEIEQYNEKTKIIKNNLPEAGQYWEDNNTGIVRLIIKIDYYENFPHSIHLEVHPSKKYPSKYCTNTPDRILYDDFIINYKYKQEGKEIRKNEIQKINEDINKLQENLSKIINEPLDSHLFNRSDTIDNLPSKRTHILSLQMLNSANEITSSNNGLIQLLKNGNFNKNTLLDLKETSNRHLEATKVKQEQIANLNNEIFDKIKILNSFLEEQANAEISQMQHYQEQISKLNIGMDTLSLYLGEEVEVIQLKKGARSIGKQPITLFQAKKYIDEEISIYTDFDEGEFDFEYKDNFIKTLQNNTMFLNSLIPMEKGLILFSWRRTDKEYNTQFPFESAEFNRNNKKTFLLFRDGENIWLIKSPIEDHKSMKRLFPTEEEMANIFKQKNLFNHETEDITINNVNFTDSIKEYSNKSLAYIRFAILLNGLQDREHLLGELPLDVSYGKLLEYNVQKEVYNFIYDDEQKKMVSDGLLDFAKWVDEKNKNISKGSRLVSWNNSIFSSATLVPSAYTQNMYDTYARQLYFPIENSNICIVDKKNSELIIKIPAMHQVLRENKRNLTVFLKQGNFSDIKFLCLDNVRSEEIYSYIRDNTSRKNYIKYLFLFKQAYLLLKKEEKQIKEYIELFIEKTGTKEMKTKINSAINIWRIQNNYELPPKINSLKYSKFENRILSDIQSETKIEYLKNRINEMNLSKNPLAISFQNNTYYLYTFLNKKTTQTTIDLNLKTQWFVKFEIKLLENDIQLKFLKYSPLLSDKLSKETILYSWGNLDKHICYSKPKYLFKDIKTLSLQIKHFKSLFVNETLKKHFSAKKTKYHLSKEFRETINKQKLYTLTKTKLFPIFCFEDDNSKLQTICLSVASFLFYLNNTNKDLILKIFNEYGKTSSFDRIYSDFRYLGFAVLDSKNALKGYSFSTSNSYALSDLFNANDLAVDLLYKNIINDNLKETIEQKINNIIQIITEEKFIKSNL